MTRRRRPSRATPELALAPAGRAVSDGRVNKSLLRGLVLAPALVLVLSGSSFAGESSPPAPWDHLGTNLTDVFSGSNLSWYGASVASSVALAETGADYGVRTWTRRHVRARGFADACVVGGYVLPAVAAPSIYLLSLATGDRKASYAGAAALQSLTLTVLTVGALKWGIGRPYPNNGRDPNDPKALDYPQDARLASLEPFGEHWMMAWPSGHTAATMSIAAALYGFAPEDAWLGWVGYPLALGIGAGMMVGDHHWASDVVAGAMIGHAVGYSTGRGFRRAFDGSGAHLNTSSYPVIQAVQPILLASGGWGVGLTGAW